MADNYLHDSYMRVSFDRTGRGVKATRIGLNMF
jgi:hypothetical protein